MSHDINTGVLMLLTPHEGQEEFTLYREGDAAKFLNLSPIEAENLIEALQQHVKGGQGHVRVVIPKIEKPRKANPRRI